MLLEIWHYYEQPVEIQRVSLPTRENSRPITNPTFEAKIRKALQIIGQATVSQEDIWRLEREGKL